MLSAPQNMLSEHSEHLVRTPRNMLFRTPGISFSNTRLRLHSSSGAHAAVCGCSNNMFWVFYQHVRIVRAEEHILREHEVYKYVYIYIYICIVGIPPVTYDSYGK